MPFETSSVFTFFIVPFSVISVVNFASPEILEMTNTTRPLPDAIREFFAVDPHLESAAIKILDYAGYGDDLDAEDPTKG